MNHDELLTKITHHMLDIMHTGFNDYKAHNALRAVVELHKPTPEPVFVSELECKICDSSYPCFTIQAIEKELKWI